MAKRPSTSRPQRDRRVAAAPASAHVASAATFADSNRALVVLGLFALAALVFFGRLFFLQVIKAEEFSAEAEASRTITYQTMGHRGTIYDREGRVLAMSVDATTIYADPTAVEDAKGSAAKLAEVLGGEAEDYEAKLTGEGTFQYLKRQATVEEGDAVKALELPGVHFIADTRREYPNGAIGGQIIGYCNVDGEGITGLELQYDDILRGQHGEYSAEVGLDASGRQTGAPIVGGEKTDLKAVNGQDIMISLDIELQEYVETVIAEGAETMGAGGGSCVIMDGATGEIYAACSTPYMDPTNMAESEPGSDQLKPVTQAFEPGSIFKAVSALTLLETTDITPDDQLFCPSYIEADGYQVSDAHERPDVTYTFRQILNYSSNVGFSLLVEQMGFQVLYDHIQKYNLDEPTGVDYPGESGGLLNDFGTWAKITGYNVSFGHGITVTPLQMVRFYGALTNEGVEVTPHFLVKKTQTDEVPEWPTEDVVENKDALPTTVDMLKTVVTDGTATAAAIDGIEVAGKTGTAEIAVDGTYAKSLYNLSFVGFLPDTNSQLVCFVGASEVPYDGSVTHLFRDIMTFAKDRYKISAQ